MGLDVCLIFKYRNLDCIIMMPLCIRTILTSSNRDVQRLDSGVKCSARGYGQHPMAQELRLQGKSVTFTACRTKTLLRSARSHCHVLLPPPGVLLLLMLCHNYTLAPKLTSNLTSSPGTTAKSYQRRDRHLTCPPLLAHSSLPGSVLLYLKGF